LRDEAVKRRRELAPKAAAEDVEEARVLQSEDPDTAKARVQQALTLDPGNPDARALATKLKLELPPMPAGAPAPVVTQLGEAPAKEPAPPPVKEPPPPRPAPVAKAPPPPKKTKPAAVAREEAPPPTKGDGPSPAVNAAYKAKDFGNAEKIYRQEARGQSPKAAEKTLAMANQVRDLKQAVDKATADEPKNPQAAIRDYEDAVAIDAKVGKGMHAAYFRGRIGKLQLPLAQQAFAQGRYDVAFASMQQAQKAGAGDGGLGKQLESKAKELTDKGAAMQKTNPAQAKTYWRQVIKMVPPTSPTYARAYQLINQGSGGHKDEDED